MGIRSTSPSTSFLQAPSGAALLANARAGRFARRAVIYSLGLHPCLHFNPTTAHSAKLPDQGSWEVLQPPSRRMAKHLASLFYGLLGGGKVSFLPGYEPQAVQKAISPRGRVIKRVSASCAECIRTRPPPPHHVHPNSRVSPAPPSSPSKGPSVLSSPLCYFI